MSDASEYKITPGELERAVRVAPQDQVESAHRGPARVLVPPPGTSSEPDPFKVPDDPVTGIGEFRLVRGLQRGGKCRRLIACCWLVAIVGGIAFTVIKTYV